MNNYIAIITNVKTGEQEDVPFVSTKVNDFEFIETVTTCIDWMIENYDTRFLINEDCTFTFFREDSIEVLFVSEYCAVLEGYGVRSPQYDHPVM